MNSRLSFGRVTSPSCSFFWAGLCKYFCVLFFPPKVSTCREGKLGGFSLFFATHPILGFVQDLGCAPFWALFSCFPFVMVFPRALTRSIDIKLGVLPEGTSVFDTAKALRDYFAEEAQFKVVAIQQRPNRIARVTFEEGGEAAKADFQDQGFIQILGVECEVISPAPPVEKVLVYNFPYENNDCAVHKVLADYGLIEGISYQTWVGLPGIHTGTRVVKMVRSSPIPRSLVIAGVRCKVWYRGQPVTCDFCREEGHVAAKCPNKGRCFHCRQQGHVARDCPDRPGFYGRGAWGPLPNRGLPGREPGESAGGGPPTVVAHCVEQSSLSVGDVPSCPSPLLNASSIEGGVPDCRGSPSAVASCSGNVSSVASVCDSNVLDDNGLLIVKVSNGNSSNVMDSAISNVSGDPPISNVSNIVNASNVSCADNVSNIDNINASAGNVRTGCPDSGVPLFDLADGVASDSPPSSGDSEMVPASGPRKRSASESPLEDSSAPPGLALGPVAKEAGISKVSRKNSGGRGHHHLPGSVSLAAERASSRGRPPF